MKNIFKSIISMAMAVAMVVSLVPSMGEKVQAEPGVETGIEYNTGLLPIEVEVFEEPIIITQSKSISRLKLNRSIDDSYWKKFESKYYYDRLNENEKLVYDDLYSLCMKYLTQEIDIPKHPHAEEDEFYAYIGNDSGEGFIDGRGISNGRLEQLVLLFANANPQFYFIGNAMGFGRLSDDSTIKDGVYLGFYKEYADAEYRKIKTSKFKTKIDTLTASVTGYSSDYQKIESLYNIVGRELNYESNLYTPDEGEEEPYDVPEGETLGSEHQSCSSALLGVNGENEGTTVCAGYAETLELLARKVGLDCITVTSLGHEWNQVKLDGKWYNFDITWDDNGDSDADKTYFAKSDNDFKIGDYAKTNHTPQSFYNGVIPICLASYGEYAINYNLNGGNFTSNNIKTSFTGSDNIALSIPVKTGYTFGGWYENSSFNGSEITSTTGKSNDITVYAKWIPNTYTISFDGNSGFGSMSAISASYDSSITLPNNIFTKEGYTFTGWDTESNGSGTNYADGAIIPNITANITLYAQWKLNETNNDSNNGTDGDIGNAGNNAGTGTSTGTSTGALSSAKYTITFDGNKANSGKMSAMTDCAVGSEYALSANQFTKKGYTFTGWNTKANGKGQAYANNATVSNLSTSNGATIKLYAQWKKTNYKIKYNLNKGKNNKKNPTKFTITTKTIKLKAPTRKGYKFVGWYTNKKCKGKKFTQIKKGTYNNITLYAKWKKA